MPRGQPDYGAYASKEFGAGISDMGELAARLGSIAVYDKRGDVIDFDNFEAARLKWQYVVSDATCSLTLDDTYSFSGNQAVKIHLPATINLYGEMWRPYAVFGSQTLGMEIAVGFDSNHHDIFVKLNYYTGTLWYKAWLKLDTLAEKLYLRTTGGGYQELATLGHLMDVGYVFYPIKVVADFGIGKYVRVIMAGAEYDASDIDIYSIASVAAPYLQPGVRVENRDGIAGNSWIDNYILTMNEP